MFWKTFILSLTASSEASGQSTARLQRWLISTQVPSSQVNLSGKQVVKVNTFGLSAEHKVRISL